MGQHKRCCRYRLCLESLNDAAAVVVIDAILSSSSHSGEQKGKKVPADFPTVESCYLTNYTTVTTLKSIVLDLFFFHLKWHRASLLCCWIACRSNQCIKRYNVCSDSRTVTSDVQFRQFSNYIILQHQHFKRLNCHMRGQKLCSFL